MMGATNPGWKKSERGCAAILGGRRRWLSRSNRKGGGDIDHPRLEVEVKHVAKFGPRAARAALAAMPPGEKIRVVVHRAKRAKGPDAWHAYLDLADLFGLLGLQTPAVAGVPILRADMARGVLVRLALRDLARLVGGGCP